MINVFVNYYEDGNNNRNQELLKCINNNINNFLFNFVMLESKNRLTYNDFFRFINIYSCDNDINVISNLDIYFDETIYLMNNIRKNELYALCRWEELGENNIKFSNRPDSQDVWAFRGYVNIDCNFCLGYAGCDNRVAKVFADNGWKVLNPSKSIRTIHVHNSNVRNYRIGYTNIHVVPGPYLTLPPTTLEEIGIV
jgi:hypothetical protein